MSDPNFHVDYISTPEPAPPTAAFDEPAAPRCDAVPGAADERHLAQSACCEVASPDRSMMSVVRLSIYGSPEAQAKQCDGGGASENGAPLRPDAAHCAYPTWSGEAADAGFDAEMDYELPAFDPSEDESVAGAAVPDARASVETRGSAPWRRSGLSAAHVADLAKSGIPQIVAEDLGFRSADEPEVQDLLGRDHAVGTGMVIPYHGPTSGRELQIADGAGRVPYVRIRLDDPSRAAKSGDSRPPKYLARGGTDAHPYVVPALARRLATGSVKDLILTEGEKKAVAGHVHGLDVIGLPGNWGWKYRGERRLHPSLDGLLRPWTSVTVVWDSDAVLNPAFAASSRMLHDALRAKRCPLKIVVLPQAGVRKVGMDDFLLQRGADELRSLIQAARRLDPTVSVDQGELILSWLPALQPALRELRESDGRALMADYFSKGFLDRVPDRVRLDVLQRLSAWSTWDVRSLFYDLARSMAVNAALAQVQSALPPPQPGIPIGSEVGIPGHGQAVVERVDADLLWVARKPRGPESWPVLSGVASVSRVGPGRGDKQCSADLADQFLKSQYSRDGARTIAHFRGEFYTWQEGRYRVLPRQDIEASVMAFLRNHGRMQANSATLGNVLSNLKACDTGHVNCAAELPLWLEARGEGSARQLLATTNGILDLEAKARGERNDDKVFRPPTPNLFTLTGLPVGLDLSATCPRFERFLEQVLPEKAVRNLIQEFFGYCLLPDTRLQRFFLFYGAGSNGKSVITHVLTKLLGGHNTCSVSLARFNERFSLWPLGSCLLNAVAEMPSAEAGSLTRIAEDKLKAVVSGDLIEVERKNQDVISIRPTARLLFSTNELPPFSDRSNGLWRRLIIVPFHVVIADADQDPDLAETIVRDELPGILNWAIKGHLRLHGRGQFEEPQVSRDVKLEHRGECAPEQEFLTEYVAAGTPADFTPTEFLYEKYRAFCGTGGYPPLNCKKFVRALKRRFPNAADDRRRADPAIFPNISDAKSRGYRGINFIGQDAIQ